jgi:predicted esterase
MATALLPTRPSLLAGAILLRPLSPFRHGLPTRTDGTPALIIDGERNRRRLRGDGLRLVDRLDCDGDAPFPAGWALAYGKEWEDCSTGGYR